MQLDVLNHLLPLHTNTQRGYPAPHKAVLLLSILDLVETGDICSHHIFLSDKLIDKFHSNWNRYVGNNPLFTPDIGKPFWHLQHEPFWKLVPLEGGDDFLESIKKSAPYSIKKLRSIIRYAELTPELFTQMKDPQTRINLRIHLIETYITPLFKNK